MGFRDEAGAALRGLGRSPGYALTASGTLALALGGVGAVLGLTQNYLHPLDVPEAHRLVSVWETHDGQERWVAPANYLDWRREAHTLAGLAAYDVRGATLTVDGVAQRASVAQVSGNFFQVLGVAPRRGPGLTQAFDPAFAGLEAVVSHAFWRTAYSGAPDVVGRTLRVEDLAYTIVGVMPPGFTFPEGTQAWVRARTEAPEIRGFAGDLTQLRDAWYAQVVGRLAPSASLEAVRAEMDGVAERLSATYPDTNGGAGVLVRPLREELVAELRPTLLLLGLAVALVLLAATVNVIHLAEARGAARRTDTAVRVALGAGRSRLVRATLVQSWAIGLGAALAGWALAALLPALESLEDGGARLTAPDGVVTMGIVGVALLVSSVIAGVSFVRAGGGEARADLLRSRGMSAAGRGRWMVALQVATGTVLLASAGLLTRSMVAVGQVDLGIETEDLVLARMAFPDARLLESGERLGRFERLAELVASRPGVSSAGFAASSPLAMGMEAGLLLAGQPETRPPSVGWQPVDARFMRTAGFSLVAGRWLDHSDAEGTQEVAVVNEALVRARFPGGEALGRQVTIGLDGHDRPLTIVGVVADTRSRGPTAAPGPVLYRPVAQAWRWSGDAAVLAVRLERPADPAAVIAALRRAAPELPLYDVAVGEDIRRPFTATMRTLRTVLAIFAGTALALGFVGMYGVTSTWVARRRREWGIRIAVGAGPGRLMREVLGSAGASATAGALAGTALAVLMGRALRAHLFEVAPSDPPTLAVAAFVMMGVCVAALAVPARRASRTDAAEALRGD